VKLLFDDDKTKLEETLIWPVWVFMLVVN